MNLRLNRENKEKKKKTPHDKDVLEQDNREAGSDEIQISYSRFGVEINVSPEPFGKLIVVYVTCKQS